MNFRDNIFVGITSINGKGRPNNWKKQLEDVKKLKIKKVCIFPTILSFEERKEFYKELENSEIEEIPLVHIRKEDFTEEELDYFIKRFKTKWFNGHFTDNKLIFKRFEKYKEKLLFELHHHCDISELNEIDDSINLCIDISHTMRSKLIEPKVYEWVVNHSKTIKANHLNAFDIYKNDSHHIKQKFELEYIKKMPLKLFSEVIALELDNSIKSQLKYKEKIIEILNSKLSC